MPKSRTWIGTTVVSESLASDIDSFWFSLKGAAASPFDFVSVKSAAGTRTIGIIDDLRVALLGRAGTTVARTVILANTAKQAGQPVMPVAPGRKVRFADADEVLHALGVPEMENPIPAGVINMTSGLQVPVSLDVSYIAGPDTAHVNAAGISGNRKTSYLLFLLEAAYQRLAEKGVSLIIFNTKEAELLQVDVEREKELPREDRELYRLMELDARPFSNAMYFLPRGSDGRPNSSLVPANSKTYSYELADIHDRLELLFSHTSDPMYDGLMSIANYVGEAWPVKSGGRQVASWSDLAAFAGYPEQVVTHEAVLAHFLGYLKRFRKSTLFVDRRKTSIVLADEIRKIKAGDVYVVDLAYLPTLEEQSLVVGDVMRTVDEMYSARSGRPSAKAKYLLIFVDEVNRFMPSSVAGAKRMSATAEQIARTVIAGKSRGTVLFSAQQFKSSVDDALHDNTGTHMFAKLGLTELSKPSYHMAGESVKKNIVRLNKGDIIMTHPAFRHPVRISFPQVSFRRP